MPPAEPRRAALVEFRAEHDAVTLVLDPGGPSVVVSLPLEPVIARALGHLLGLHAHAYGCGASLDVHVGLLLRCIRACGGIPMAVVVRGGPAPAFWLRLLRPGGAEAHVDLSLLDGFCLLLSQHVAVELDRADAPDWDEALSALLDDPAD